MTIEQVSGLALPTTIAIGHAEAGPNPAAFGPGIVAAMPKAQLQEYPHLGHFGPLQDPDSVAEDILAFAERPPNPDPELLGGRDGVCRVSHDPEVLGGRWWGGRVGSGGEWVVVGRTLGPPGAEVCRSREEERPGRRVGVGRIKTGQRVLGQMGVVVDRRVGRQAGDDRRAWRTQAHATRRSPPRPVTSVSESSGSLADGGSGTHPGSSVTRPSVERNPST